MAHVKSQSARLSETENQFALKLQPNKETLASWHSVREEPTERAQHRRAGREVCYLPSTPREREVCEGLK